MLKECYSRSRISNYSHEQILTVLDNKGEIHEGNSSFYAIWSKLDGNKTIYDVIKDIQSEYNITEESELMDDVLHVVETMKELGIVEYDRKFVPPINHIDNKILATHFAITSYCNLRCSHCYLKEKNNIYVSSKDFENVLNELANNGILSIEISGGEPMTHKSFLDFINLAKRYGFYIKLFTNATLINESNVEILKRSIDSFRVSLDGAEKTHELRRGKGSFHKTISAIKLLRGSNVQVSMTVDDINYDELGKVKQISENLGAKFEASPVVPYSHIQFTNDKLRLIQSKINGGLLAENCIGQRAEYRGINCEAGKRLLYVNSNLDVTPCPLLHQEKWHIGNLRQNSLHNILYGDEYNHVVNKLNILRSKCAACNACQFWCAAIVDQSIDNISPLCVRKNEQ